MVYIRVTHFYFTLHSKKTMTEAEFQKLCADLGGVWDKRRKVCKFPEPWRPAEEVLNCIAKLKEKTPIEWEFSPDEEIINSCLDETLKGLPVRASDLDEIKAEVWRTIEDAESEPDAQIFDEEDELIEVITPYRRPAGFDAVWVSTDPWRGYNEIKTSDKWSSLHTDVALHHSLDEEYLEDFDTLLKGYLRLRKIPFRTVISRTSNVFASGYDIFVPTDRKAEVEEYVKRLREIYRDPARFTLTALLGHDPPYSREELAFGAVACEILKKKKRGTGLLEETSRREDVCEGL
jgi:hypothetical protein